jgi:hypothetical protein
MMAGKKTMVHFRRGGSGRAGRQMDDINVSEATADCQKMWDFRFGITDCND